VVCLEGGREIPAALEPDGLHFQVSPRDLVIERSGSYWFTLTDLDGLTGSEARSEIVAVADQPPTVTIARPAADLFVTPAAVVPLRVVARDDLAIQAVRLIVGRDQAAHGAHPAPQKDVSIALYSGPPRAARQPAGGRAAEAEGQRQVIDYRWELGTLGLAPGTQIVYYAAASDYRPQTGKSDPRRLSVITAEELQERIAARQHLLLAELARVLKLQRDARQQVEALQIRVHRAGGLEALEVDHLQAAELGQRQVGHNLTSRQDGVAMHLVALLADLENNRLDNPDFQRRARAFLGEIERLQREPLPRIGRELAAAIKSAQVRLQEKPRPSAADAATAASLGRGLTGQDEVIASLEAMLAQLRQWDDYRRFHRDVAQLLREQADVGRSTAEIGRLTLTRELKDLTPQETADLAVLAARQLDLARRLDRIQQEMGQAAAELRQGDPLAADMLADALDEAQRLALAAAMRSAAALVEENRIGRAAETHKQVLAGLQEVLDVLANRRQQELSRLVRKLAEAEEELRAIQQQQERLHNELAAAGSPAEKGPAGEDLRALGRRQEALRDATERLARRLERLLAEQAGRVAQRAAGEMSQAGQAAARQDRGAATRGAEAAQKSLAEAVGLLAGRRLQAQAELALEQLARLQDALKHLGGRQRQVLDQTRQIEATRQRGPSGRAEAAGLRDLARLEQSLQAQAAGLAEGMAAAAAFHTVLVGVAGEMGHAADALQRGQTGPAAQQPQQDALARLDLILQALEPEKPGAEPSGGGDGTGQAGTPPGGVQTLSEIKLLKLLQEDINLRTEKLSAPPAAAGQPGDEHRKLLGQLSEEQGRLADLVLRLAPPESKQKQEPEEPLVSVGREMREVQTRMSQNDAGPVTRHLQQQIVSDLDRLMEEARKSAGQPLRGTEPKTAGRTPTGPPAPSPQPKPSSKGGTQPGQASATESNPEIKRKPEDRQAELLKLQRGLLKPGSGIELPPRMRDSMYELPAEEVLPQYEVLTEEYFRRLSEPKTHREYER